MALIRKNLLLLAVLSAFTGCHNMCADLEDTIGDTCWYDRLYWEDVSDTTYDFSSKERYSMITEDGKPVVKVSSGSGNWTLFRDDIKGFEVDVKCASGAAITGCQFYSTAGYSCFEEYITSDGRISVRYTDKNGTETRLFTSEKIIDDITVYNTLSMVLQKDRSINVYCNGQRIYTIKGYSISYGIVTAQMNSSGYSYYRNRRVMR